MNYKDPRECIDRGNVARRAGRLEEALAHYRSALDAAPDNAEASSLYGLVLVHLGKPAEAEAALRKAVSIEPRHVGYWMNLAALFDRSDRLDEGIAAYNTVCKLMPEFPRAWERLGDLLLRTERAAEALASYDRAAVIEPHDQTLVLKRGSALFRMGRTDEARRTLEGLMRAAPHAPELLRVYANVLTAQTDWSALERIASAWVAAHPADADGWQALTTAMYETGRLREAMELYRNVLQYAGRDAQRLTVYAQYCLNVAEFDEAESALAEAERQSEEHVEMLSTRALSFMYNGRLDEAEAYCRRALKLDPEHIPAYRVLNQLKRGHLSADERGVLATLKDRSGGRIGDRITAAFSYADSLDASGDFAAAFACYSYANKLGLDRAVSEGISYDPAQRAVWTETLISLFSSVPPPHGQQERGPRPIFIVGMPRSGTTLVESIVAAHSQVLACGERTVMPQILINYIREAKGSGGAQIAGERWLNWLRAYWYELPRIGTADHITDKNPFNFESAGLITRLFPEAKIIHVRRNPVETGLSIFRNQFPKFVTFANSLGSIGHYYGQYARLVAHWERVLGNRFVTIQYENLVAHFDRAVPRLIEACGLPWEADCLRFAESNRPVATLSAVQVRSGVGQQERRVPAYRAHLAPLIEALSAAGVDLETGALRR